MALPTLSPDARRVSRRRIQPEVSQDTARILHAASKLTDREIGEIIDDLVSDNLSKLIDVKGLVESHPLKEERNAAE